MNSLERLHFQMLKTALLEKCLCKGMLNKHSIIEALEEVISELKECQDA